MTLSDRLNLFSPQIHPSIASSPFSQASLPVATSSRSKILTRSLSLEGPVSPLGLFAKALSSHIRASSARPAHSTNTSQRRISSVISASHLPLVIAAESAAVSSSSAFAVRSESSSVFSVSSSAGAFSESSATSEGSLAFLEEIQTNFNEFQALYDERRYREALEKFHVIENLQVPLNNVQRSKFVHSLAKAYFFAGICQMQFDNYLGAIKYYLNAMKFGVLDNFFIFQLKMNLAIALDCFANSNEFRVSPLFTLSEYFQALNYFAEVKNLLSDENFHASFSNGLAYLCCLSHLLTFLFQISLANRRA